MAALLLTELAATAGLWQVGRAPFMTIDLTFSEPLDSVMALARVAALGGVMWLTLSTIICLFSTVKARPRFTSAYARRLVDGILAAAVVSSAVAPPAMAAPAETIAAGGPAGIIVPPGATLVPPSPPAPESASVPEAAPLPLPAGGARPASSVVVRRGDNLWTISARHLRSVDAHPSARQIAVYWTKVVAANRDAIRSGDPNLIYPGETVLLPPP
jgi:hypothetical protein